MTAPLYVRDGSRFVVYDPARQHTPPILVEPVPVDDGEPTAERPVVEARPGVYRVYAPKCPHGLFLRYALGRHPKTHAPNCRPCHATRSPR